MTTASDIALFAINTGEWYEKHKSIAIKDTHKPRWILWIFHVSFCVFPAFQRTEPDADLRKVMVRSVCEQLDTYYVAHLREMFAQRDAEISEQAEDLERGK